MSCRRYARVERRVTRQVEGRFTDWRGVALPSRGGSGSGRQVEGVHVGNVDVCSRTAAVVALCALWPGQYAT